MERETGMTIHSVPSDVWEFVSSYLDLESLLHLVRACDKILRLKLVSSGAIKTLDFTGCNAYHRLLCWWGSRPPFPSLVSDYPGVSSNLLSLLKLPGITSLTLHPWRMTLAKMVNVEQLPLTLTHLDYQHTSNLHFPLLRESLPNLKHLSWQSDDKPPTVFSWTNPHNPLTFLQSLPQGLLSLRVKGTKAKLLLGVPDFYSLLPNLTYLSIFETLFRVHEWSGTHTNPAQTYLPTLNATLPSSITELQLPLYRINGTEWPFSYLPNLQALHLHSIIPGSQSSLPTTIKRLSITLVPEESRLGPLLDPYWTANIETLEIGRCLQSTLPCLPSVVKLKVLHRANDKWGICADHLCPISNFSSKLVIFENPNTVFSESLLEHLPPSLTYISACDIIMDGSSLFAGIEYLDTVQQIRDCFWQKSRPYRLVLHTHGAPTLVNGPLKTDLSKLVSLTIPEHSTVDFTVFSDSLTTLKHANLHSERLLSEIPSSLKELHFYQRYYDPALQLTEILFRFPSLTNLSTTAGKQLTCGGRLALGSEFFPWNKFEFLKAERRMEKSAATASMIGHPKIASSSVLVLPKDAIRTALDKYQGIVSIHGFCKWETDFIFDGLSRLPPIPVIQLSGGFVISEEILKNGFGEGTIGIDLVDARFYIKGNSSTSTVVPQLPSSLIALYLGGEQGKALLKLKTEQPILQLPSGLQLLRLVLQGRPNYQFRFRLINDLPTSLSCLEVQRTQYSLPSWPSAMQTRFPHFLLCRSANNPMPCTGSHRLLIASTKPIDASKLTKEGLRITRVLTMTD